MKKLLLISLFLSISIFATETPMRTGTFPDKEMQKQNKEIAKLVAKEISSTLPQIVDKYTTLISVKNDELRLIYTFKINTGSKSDKIVQKEDHSRMKKAVTTGICQSSRKFIEAGISTSYVYISAKTSARLFQFDITQKECIAALK